MDNTENQHYPPRIIQAWRCRIPVFMPFYGDACAEFIIHGLDFGYGVAELECVNGAYKDLRQSIALPLLHQLLDGIPLSTQATFYYVCRWFDADNVPHFFGVYSKYATLEEAQRLTRFHMIDVPVDLVYQAIDEDDMQNYLSDVNRNDSAEHD